MLVILLFFTSFPTGLDSSMAVLLVDVHDSGNCMDEECTGDEFERIETAILSELTSALEISFVTYTENIKELLLALISMEIKLSVEKIMKRILYDLK